MSGTRFWAVVPAAGIGRRMGSDTPKQYLPLRGRFVIEHTLERLGSHPAVAGVAIAVRSVDPWWPSVRLGSMRPMVASGGDERFHSVRNALECLAGSAAEDDWVLVHDAVRPCLRAQDIDRLVDAAARGCAGAVLGVPVRDTMKRTGPDGLIRTTVDREALWHAHTPQMFRVAALTRALDTVIANGLDVTDEAQAMEQAGVAACMVEGHPDNIKITRLHDMVLAELYLAAQSAEAACA